MVAHKLMDELKKMYGGKLTYTELKTMYAIYSGPYEFLGKNSQGVVWIYHYKSKYGNLVHLRPIPSVIARCDRSGFWRNNRGFVTSHLNERTYNEIMQCIREIIDYLEANK